VGEAACTKGFGYSASFIVVFSISIVARRIMLEVDVDELERLRYGYKGA